MGSRSFGQAVDSLLDTYSKCLALLKGTRQERRSSEPQARLGSSLRSDRARIRRVYSSRLSENGVRFDKGDGESYLSVVIKGKRIVMYLKHV